MLDWTGYVSRESTQGGPWKRDVRHIRVPIVISGAFKEA
jgi:hypothetical protein